MDKQGIDRKWTYALCGVCLGVLAPVGWIVLRLVLFEDGTGNIWARIFGNIAQSRESIALFIYMGGGTAAVLGVFGFFIGNASQQIHQRALRLDALNQEVASQKEVFERRFLELNNNLKNFHSINNLIQKSIDPLEVFRLSTDGLHEVLGYDRVNLLQVNKEQNRLDFVASRGSGQDDVKGMAVPLDDRGGALFRAVKDNRVILVEDITRMPEEFHLKPPCDHFIQLRSKHFILCPIVVQDEVTGLIAVDNKVKRKRMDETDVDTVKLFADQVSATLTKISLLEGVETLTRELAQTFAELLRYREEHSRCDSSLHRATSATSESIADIVKAADVISHGVETTRSAASEISVSIDQVSQNIKQLSEFVDKSISSMTEIGQTIKSVEENGCRSHTMSETVRRQAEDGVAGIGDTVQGLKALAASVEDAVAAINRLAEKGEEIGIITGVINEITQKTNLLALNASIIAAQAGENGRSFSVVAEEVRNLSQEAAQSTGAISLIVHEIQSFTRDTVDRVGQTRVLVQQGIDKGEMMDGSLKTILQSADQAMTMAHDILRATREVARAVDSVSHSIEDLGEMSTQVSVASREQANGTRSIVRSIEEVKAMADDMVEATARQQHYTRDIEGAVSQVSGMMGKIFAAMEARQVGSQDLVKRLESLKGRTGDKTGG
jgi:methyl-accepting chemotaxis protein